MTARPAALTVVRKVHDAEFLAMSLQHHSRPRFGKIRTAVEYGGVSRSALYLWAARRPELFRKNGVKTLVDFSVLDSMLDELPIAEIKAASPRKPSATP
jgi:hypothetical protein